MARKLTGQLPSDALTELKQREGDYDPPAPAIFNEEPPVPAPEPPRIPPPDWRGEERDRAERAAGEAEPPVSEPEPAESLQPRPAPKRNKPKATPNLDKVRAMLDKGAP
jgi:hypothetical protein